MVGNQLKHICSRTGRPDKAGNCNVGWQKTYKAQDGKTNKAENSKNLHTYSLNLPISLVGGSRTESMSCNEPGKS